MKKILEPIDYLANRVAKGTMPGNAKYIFSEKNWEEFKEELRTGHQHNFVLPVETTFDEESGVTQVTTLRCVGNGQCEKEIERKFRI